MTDLSTEADTIVAIATPLGVSPRAICRLSGPDALHLAHTVFAPPCREGSTYVAIRGAVRVHLRAGSIPPSDVPATLYVMRAPRSYTREDVAELHVPGSPPIIAALLRTLAEHGARPARPGEFTRRAFVHGRLDLAQAEAVLGVIRAADDEQLRSALAGLGTAARRRFQALSAALDRVAALVELGIDFSEEDLAPAPGAEIAARLDSLAADLKALAAAEPAAETDGPAAIVALTGLANSGKSSLMNALVGRKRSIVSHVAGTTRDVVTAPLTVGRWRLTLADTAGGPGADDALGAAAWAAAQAQTHASHAVLLVIDRSVPLTPDAGRWIERRAGAVVIVLNKCDLPSRVTADEVAGRWPGVPVVEVSAATGEGIEALRRALAGAFAEGRVRVGAEGLLLPVRQARAARRALDAVRRAQTLAVAGDRPELVALELRAARAELDDLTGRGVAQASEEVLDSVFSQFCIGK